MSHARHRVSPEVAEQRRKSAALKREIAENYVRQQLSVMDGTTEAGLRRIGTERFEQTVVAVMNALPWPEK